VLTFCAAGCVQLATALQTGRKCICPTCGFIDSGMSKMSDKPADTQCMSKDWMLVKMRAWMDE